MRDNTFRGFIIVPIVASLVLAGYAVGSEFPMSTKAEVAQVEQTEPRFQLQDFDSWDYRNRGQYYSMAVICDTHTGTLIYSSGYRGGLWGVPNGCHKNPR